MGDVVAIFGAGYVGIPTAIRFAEAPGWEVRLIEPDERRRAVVLDAMETGADVLGEPGTGSALRDLRGLIRVEASCETVIGVDLAVCCVGTPSAGGDLDRSAVRKVARVAWGDPRHLAPLVIRSTCSPTFVQELLRDRPDGAELAVVPEFLREGYALSDARTPSRIVLGSRGTFDLARAGLVLAALGGPETPVVTVRPEEAALAKLAANAFLASKVVFGRHLAALVEAVLPGCDVGEVLEAMELDPRIGRGHLSPGLGPAGPCLPKDSAAFARLVTGWGSALLLDDPRILASIDSAAEALAIRISGGHLAGAGPVQVWGVGFKPVSPDWRDSPAIELIRELLVREIPVNVWDPRLSEEEMQTAVLSQIGPAAGRVVIGRGEGLPIVVLLTRAGFPDARFPISLLSARGEVWDPYALLDVHEARELVRAGVGYHGGGRGEGWPSL